MSNPLSGPPAPKQRPVRMVKCQFPAEVYDALAQISATAGVSPGMVVGFLVAEHLGFLAVEEQMRQAEVAAAEPTTEEKLAAMRARDPEGPIVHDDIADPFASLEAFASPPAVPAYKPGSRPSSRVHYEHAPVQGPKEKR